jgi:hypothetical protein
VGVYFSLLPISKKKNNNNNNNSHTTLMSNTFIYVRTPFIRGNNEKEGKCFKVVKKMNKKKRK